MSDSFRSSYLSQTLRAPIVLSVPHAGLVVPEERKDLMLLPEKVFLRDVDYEIHRIWLENCQGLDVSWIKAETHRYALDLNRRPDQIDSSMVKGHPRAAGSESKGLYWTKTTQGEGLGFSGTAKLELDSKVHQTLVTEIWAPYYDFLQAELKRVREVFGFAILIDAHSMPSRGTSFHNDSNSGRADLVPGDFHGKACDPRLTEVFCEVAHTQGFQVSVNQPYAGGGITQHFGKPVTHVHALQIEVRRDLYMDESSYELKEEGLTRLSLLTHHLLQRFSTLRLKPPF